MKRKKARLPKFGLREKLELVKGLLESWLNQESILLHYPAEKLDGNVDLLSELIGENFEDDLDLKQKVESWIKETEEKGQKRKKYLKARFKKKLFEACLTRYKK